MTIKQEISSIHEEGTFARQVDDYFTITSRGSDIWTEIRSGLVTYFTMAYIIVINAQILHMSSSTESGEMPIASVMTATILSSAIASGIVGLYGNLPFGLAPGMGLNSYFTYGVCMKLGLSWQIALTCSFFMGLLFLILSLTGACTAVQTYAPACIKKGITVGLGLFQAIIGYEMIRLVVPGQHTLLELGDMNNPTLLLALLSIVLICAMLVLQLNGAMLLGMALTTVVAWMLKMQSPPDHLFAVPSMTNTFFALDFAGFFENYQHTIPITLILLFVSLFDTAGVHFALGFQSGLLKGGHLEGSTTAFTAASIATMAGACMGTSPVIIHNETCAGIQDGARTGLSAVTIAFCFLLSLPLTPLFGAVPHVATAAPLIIVGMLMMGAAKYVDWDKIEEAFPAFLTITILPLTYSIANGMMAGLCSYAIMKPLAILAEKRAAANGSELNSHRSEYEYGSVKTEE